MGATIAGEDLTAEPLGLVDVARLQESGGLGERWWYLIAPEIQESARPEQCNQVVGYAGGTGPSRCRGRGLVFDGLREPAESR